MFRRLRQRQPGSPLIRILWWHALHYLCLVWMVSCYRYREWGSQRIPRTGPVLFLSNHQSFLDPILVGLGAHRRQFYAMARSTLFNNRFFAWLIRSLNAVPVERGESDLAAMRRCIEVLKAGNALLVFPEGTRTTTGATLRFASGTMLLIKRAMPTVVPVAVEGAFDAWPKGRKLPRGTGRVAVMYGEPIPAEQLVGMPAEQALAMLRDRVETMRQELAQRLDDPTARVAHADPLY